MTTMKGNPLSLTLFSRLRQAANDDGSGGTGESTSQSSMRPPEGERSGWDPFEVWRTRILPAQGRGTRQER